ncbi:alpha/beta fold hydrolase [Silvimonas iriomotensis]|uniref:Alpha/beta hydrolase n=1 Tax=Silvimonas iriomotensis TaxID=449662 RepID=A0ABQ2P660_9NEIS|nr:alpha/beta hydrolase [Silvimonas iriomotensis]GGP19232.1 alpha/beta hydrolase [Silvimonas iriomotensis]
MNTLKANGITLAWDSFGDESAEPLLLIAGLGTQMIRWTVPFCEALAARGFRVIRFDNRDTGGSTWFDQHPALDFPALAAALQAGKPPVLAYRLEDMAADAVGLLDALGIAQAHVVGRSMGGMIAQLVASHYPERVLSLTSIMASSGNPALPGAAPEVMALMTRPAPDPQTDLEGFIAHGLAFAQRIAGKGYPFYPALQRQWLLEEIRRGRSTGGFARQLAAIALSADRRAQLAKIRVPSLVLHGTDDPLFLPVCAQDTASAIPGARLMILPGMGHDLPLVLYDTVVDAIARHQTTPAQARVNVT